MRSFDVRGMRLVAGILAIGAAGAPALGATDPAFVRNVNLSRFRLISVQHDGRFKTFDTLAREMIQVVTGSTTLERNVAGQTIKQDAVFTYLDLLFNPEAYHDTGLIFIKKTPIRQELVRAAGASLEKSEQDRILKTGRVSMTFLTTPSVLAKLEELNRDIMRTAKDVDLLMDAARLADPRALKRQMRVLSPADATSPHERWLAIDELETSVAGGMKGEVAGLDSAAQVHLWQPWDDAAKAWKEGDAAQAGAALSEFANRLAAVCPAVYPPARKLSLEHWYYKNHKMTWVWWFYMMASVFLLMGIVYRWRRARLTGISVFGLAFCLHTVASGVRWYLAGRIPNSNMFEAVTAAAWFGAVIAIFFELGPRLVSAKWSWPVSWVLLGGGGIVFVLSLLVRGVAFNDWQNWGPVPTTSLILLAIGSMTLISMATARRFLPNGLPLLGACVVAMVALMCGRFMTVSLNSDISNRMPVLNDLWLYIHTNMIIASYALIAIAYVTAAMYVVGRLLTAPSRSLWLAMLIPSAVVPLFALLPGITLMMVLPAWAPFLIVLAVYVVANTVRLVWAPSSERAFAAWEGEPVPFGPAVVPGGRMPLVSTLNYAGGGALPAEGAGLAKVLDGATMLLMELSFITLWTGIIMGAVWADHSWGRPWGWDPKEVFALNTWIIFLILVHVRIKVRDKALWTAVLAVIGCAVMLFNWIVVNFFITGLHSYA